MSRFSLPVVLLVGLLVTGCPPSVAADYPYGLYDRDVESMIALLKSGGDGVLTVAAVDEVFEPFWGKTKDANLVKKVHVNFRAWYVLDVESTSGVRGRFLVKYQPAMGTVQIEIKALDNEK